MSVSAAVEPHPLDGLGRRLLGRVEVGEALLQVLVVVVDLGLVELPLRGQRPQRVLQPEHLAAPTCPKRHKLVRRGNHARTSSVISGTGRFTIPAENKF